MCGMYGLTAKSSVARLNICQILMRYRNTIIFQNMDPLILIKKIFIWNQMFNYYRFLKMAIPLAFSHLVKVTCLRADGEWTKKCFQEFGSKYVNDFYQKFKAANNRHEYFRAHFVIYMIPNWNTKLEYPWNNDYHSI